MHKRVSPIEKRLSKSLEWIQKEVPRNQFSLRLVNMLRALAIFGTHEPVHVEVHMKQGFHECNNRPYGTKLPCAKTITTFSFNKIQEHETLPCLQCSRRHSTSHQRKQKQRGSKSTKTFPSKLIQIKSSKRLRTFFDISSRVHSRGRWIGDIHWTGLEMHDGLVPRGGKWSLSELLPKHPYDGFRAMGWRCDAFCFGEGRGLANDEAIVTNSGIRQVLRHWALGASSGQVDTCLRSCWTLASHQRVYRVGQSCFWCFKGPKNVHWSP